MKKEMSRIIEETRELEWEPMKENPRFAKYTDLFTNTIGDKTTKTQNVGYTVIENLEKITGFEAISDRINVEGMYENKAVIAGITKENIDKLYEGKVYISDIVKTYREDADMIPVLWNWASHMIKNIDETWFIVPVHLDYMLGLNNERYDLAKVQAHLKKLKEEGKQLVGSLDIVAIPYYNCYEDHTHQIDCYYIPTYEEYEMLMQHRNREGFIVLEDILGLKPFRVESEEA